MLKPTVSVIIPTYNGGKYICQTIESVLNQSFTDIEILVVDDGSDECLSDLLSPYSKQIQYIYNKRSGPAASRNIGIRMSRGTYIALLDHDDLWHPDKLKVQVDILDKNPHCALVYCYPTLIDADGKTIPNEGPSVFPRGNVILDFLQSNRITTFSATLIRRSILDTTGLLDESPEVMTCDDYDMWLRIADISEVLFSPGDLVHYRIHAGNLLKNYDQNLEAHLFVIRKTLADSVRLKLLPTTLVRKVSRENLYSKYRYFALVHYYGHGGVKKARRLFWKVICLKPFVLSNIAYLLICNLPNSLRIYARRNKQRGGDRSLGLANE